MTNVEATCVKRLDLEERRKVVGDEVIARLQRRNRGGDAGHKGVRFEHLYAAFQVAKLSPQHYQDESKRVDIEWQSDEVVDDVVVRIDADQSFTACQLKNSSQVSWTAGKPSIADDFECQKRLSDADGYRAVDLRLVCSDKEVADTLKGAVPAAIKSFSSASHFPYEPVVLPMIVANTDVADVFSELSRYEKASPIEVENLVGVLIGAISVLGNRFSLGDVLAKARQMSPQLIRLSPTEEASVKLDPGLQKILDSWEGFKYAIIRGFLNWSYLGSTEGTLSASCVSPEFMLWQKTLIASDPKSFDEVEGMFV